MAIAQIKTNNSNKPRSLYSAEHKELSPEDIAAIEEAFPPVDPGFIPNGNRVLVQVRRPKTKTKGGIVLTESSVESQVFDEQVGRVIAIGQAAFRNPANMEEWAEDPWFEVGDFIRFPKFGGDKTWTVTPDGEKTLFIVFREYETIGKIYCNPLDIKGAI